MAELAMASGCRVTKYSPLPKDEALSPQKFRCLHWWYPSFQSEDKERYIGGDGYVTL